MFAVVRLLVCITSPRVIGFFTVALKLGRMPIYQKAKEAGVFDASEVALLGRVFEKLKIDGQSPERHEALASRVIANYQAGITDEEELVSASKLPLGR
ncbi:hypothetical protein [Mesorhizobium sp. WSM3224]|uniref:hypothetical protein n=2 Tax=Mesorhizobium sp. WSM3224 TaxID=1040986 RepID=UPI0032AFC9B5